MRLRTNESCPIHQSLFCCGRVGLLKRRLYGAAFSALKIRITREDTGTPLTHRDAETGEPEIIEQDRLCANLPSGIH